MLLFQRSRFFILLSTIPALSWATASAPKTSLQVCGAAQSPYEIAADTKLRTSVYRCTRECRTGLCEVCETETINEKSYPVCKAKLVVNDLGVTLRYNKVLAPVATVVDQPGGAGFVGEPSGSRALYYQKGFRFVEMIWAPGISIKAGVAVLTSDEGTPYENLETLAEQNLAGMWMKYDTAPWTIKDTSARQAKLVRFVSERLRGKEKYIATGCSAGAFLLSAAQSFHHLEDILSYAVWAANPGSFNLPYLCGGSPTGTPHRDFSAPHSSGQYYNEDAYRANLAYMGGMPPIIDYVYALDRVCASGNGAAELREGSVAYDADASLSFPTPVDTVLSGPALLCDVTGDGIADAVDIAAKDPISTANSYDGPDNVKRDAAGVPILDASGKFIIDPLTTCQCGIPGVTSLKNCVSANKRIVSVPATTGTPAHHKVELGGNPVNNSDVHKGPIAQTLAHNDSLNASRSRKVGFYEVGSNHCGGPTAVKACELICKEAGVACPCNDLWMVTLGN